jgi:hypothetical protein
MFFASVALAAPVSPLADVPAGHWAYSSLDKLVAAGIISSYHGKYNDGKTLTRLEMARVVAKAMARTENADPAVKRVVAKLADEFAAELDNYLIRIEEKKKKTNNFRLTEGEARLEYESSNVSKNGKHTATTISRYYLRSTLTFESKVTNDWDFTIKFRADQKFRTSGSDASATSFVNQANVRGSAGPFDVQVGRFYTGVMDTLMWDDYTDGVRIKYGDRLKATFTYGYHSLYSKAVYYDNTNAATRARGNYLTGVSTRTGNSRTNILGLELEFSPTPGMNFEGYAFRVEAPNLASTYTTKQAHYWGAKLEQKLSKDFKGSLIYMKSDAAEDNQAFLVGLSYKDTVKSKPGTYKYYVQYGKKEQNAAFASFAIYAPDTASDYHSRRVWRLGAEFIPMRNTEWISYCDFGRATDGSGYREFYLRSQMFYYF